VKQVHVRRTEQRKDCRKGLRSARRLVIKLGTSTVTEANGELCEKRVLPIVRGISELIQEGRQVVLVTSERLGSAAGCSFALGAIERHGGETGVRGGGQGLLMAAYKRMFEEHDVKVAQVLLTERISAIGGGIRICDARWKSSSDSACCRSSMRMTPFPRRSLKKKAKDAGRRSATTTGLRRSR